MHLSGIQMVDLVYVITIPTKSPVTEGPIVDCIAHKVTI